MHAVSTGILFWIVIGMSAVAALVSALPGPALADKVRMLFHVRFSLVLATMLVALPAAVMAEVGNVVLRSVFVTVDWELAVVGMMAIVAASAIVASLDLTATYAPERFAVAPWSLRRTLASSPRSIARLIGHHAPWIAVAVLSAPMIAAAILVTRQEQQYESGATLGLFGFAFLGIVGGVATGAVAAWAQRRVPPTTRRALATFASRLGPGFENERSGLYGRHVAAGVSFLSVAVIYAAGATLLRPSCHETTFKWIRLLPCLKVYVPALGYALLAITLFAFALPFCAFYFDRYRMPTTIVLIVAGVIQAVMWPVDHFFWVPQRAPAATLTSERSPTVEESIWRMMEAQARELPPFDVCPPAPPCNVPHPKSPRLVAIAANGGGITAAAWTATVLDGLETHVRECGGTGPSFRNALGVISSVSGGSIGSMFYMASLADARDPAALQHAAVEAAEEPALREVAWGFAYPDLVRILAPIVLRARRGLEYTDRGWALEQAWRDSWLEHFPSTQQRGWVGERDSSALTLNDLRAEMLTSHVPTPIFGAMNVEEGRLLLLTPAVMRFKSSANRSRVEESEQSFDTWWNIGQGNDLKLLTAARLSATFPWVSPQSTPLLDPTVKDRPWAERHVNGGLHIADGGYFDNAGVAALAEWLEEGLPAFQRCGGRQAMVVRIQNLRPRAERSGHQSGWLSNMIEPVRAMISARGASQSARNRQVVSLLDAKWARADPLSGAVMDVDVIDFVLNDEHGRLPLGWLLSHDDRAVIDRAWDLASIKADRAKVGHYLRGPSCEVGAGVDAAIDARAIRDDREKDP
ncbi:MAG: patatin-like phospholipase family protein [Ardenticatenales bacterium]|nr:patatin-like phospholipase family protein [Ardenticatenales bacterium]